MCCMRLAGNKGRKNSSSGYDCTTLSSWIYTTKACVNNWKKDLLNSNTSSHNTCPHNMANFGPLTTEICWRVWSTPAYFNGFRILAALLHGTLVVGISQTFGLKRGRHLYSAGRPSRWALAHSLVISKYNRLVMTWLCKCTDDWFVCWLGLSDVCVR